MRPQKARMRLGFSLSANGQHLAGWRQPASWPRGGMDLAAWREVVAAAERGCMHFIFLADGLGVRVQGDAEELSHSAKIDQLEPLTLLASLATTSEKIGFVSTASTSYNQPFTLARMFASLDHISRGRIGWNVVTSWSETEAQNFSLDKPIAHADRYRRANEFVDVVKGLWDSWDDGAFVRDKDEGRYFDPHGLHVLDHRGEFFSCRGPLNIPRPVQGHPLIAQAGGSAPGMELAARTADIVYTAQSSLPEAKRYYDELKGRLAKYGRRPDSLLVFPGLMPIIGRTQQEADEKLERLQSLLHPVTGLTYLRGLFGDLSSHPLDGPLPDLPPVPNAVVESTREVWLQRARRDNLTIRQLYQAVAIASGHRVAVGTPRLIADVMQEWYEAGACDGFAVMAASMPTEVFAFVDLVVPELQKRGLFRTGYEGETLRENLGLERPANGFARPAGAA